MRDGKVWPSDVIPILEATWTPIVDRLCMPQARIGIRHGRPFIERAF